jgi:pimeloyl-ACP methyl ester carboxylesterase
VDLRTTIKAALVLAVVFNVLMVAAQSAPTRSRIVHAGSATIAVAIIGQGEPIVFIPSRGRGVEDFDALSHALVRAGYQAVLPQPRRIGASTGPLKDITYHDLASDVAATIEPVVSGPVTIIGHDFGNRIARTLASDHPALVKNSSFYLLQEWSRDRRSVGEKSWVAIGSCEGAVRLLNAGQRTGSVVALSPY